MGVISITTAIPGPESRALVARRQKAVSQAVPATTAIAIAHAEGAVVTDADGNRLIDFAGGIGVLNVGHRHPQVLAAIRDQLDHYLHLAFPVSTYEPYVALAERLNSLTPGSHEKRTLFVNSGAEGVENAVKAARYFTGRQAIVCFEHAFHGRTNLALGLTAKVMPYKKGFGPFAPEIYRIPFPYCYRCPAGGPTGGAPGGTSFQAGGRSVAAGQCCQASAGYLEQLFAGVVDPKSVAAIIIELELGEGGFVPAPREYVTALSAFAKAHGILLIADEIQTGFGRTGTLFACEHYDLVPDLIVTAKSLAGGLPLAAVTGRAEILNAPQVGGLGGTYGGNPVACAAALAVLDIMERENVVARGGRVGEKLRERFTRWAARDSRIGDVRGLGAMMAIELVTDPTSKAPDKDRTGKVLSEALARGLILLSAGTFGNVVRVLVPLTIEDAVLDEGLAVMEEALEATR
jgi:4-aminobutyrate aminotransferase/(S)-3-amino-2-methylpropionate transaminase